MIPLRLASRSWGDGDRRLLLIHGLSSNAAGWWRLGSDLAAAGFSVTAVDLRGHGASPHADLYTLEAYAADVLAAGDGWYGVLGHSLGGAVAVAAAAGDPTWTQRLVLYEPALAMLDHEAAKLWLLAPWQADISEEAVAAANPEWNPEDVRHKVRALAQTGPEVVTGTIDGNPNWDLRPQVGRLRMPVLILAGDPARGSIVPRDALAEAAAAGPNIEVVTCDGAGHSFHREDDHYPAALAAVGGFFAG